MHLGADPTAPSIAASLSGNTFSSKPRDPPLITCALTRSLNRPCDDAAATSNGHSYPRRHVDLPRVSASVSKRPPHPASPLPPDAAALHRCRAILFPAAHRSMQPWLDTQPEGWWRLALDNSTAVHLHSNPDLRRRILSPLRIRISALRTVAVAAAPSASSRCGGMHAMANSDITPNLGRIDSTPASSRPSAKPASPPCVTSFSHGPVHRPRRLRYKGGE